MVKITISRPTRDEFRFNKPYFLTAMLGYLVTYLILAVAVVLSKSDFPPMSSGLFASYISPIVMTVMVGALAVFRQESGAQPSAGCGGHPSGRESRRASLAE